MESKITEVGSESAEKSRNEIEKTISSRRERKYKIIYNSINLLFEIKNIMLQEERLGGQHVI